MGKIGSKARKRVNFVQNWLSIPLISLLSHQKCTLESPESLIIFYKLVLPENV